MTAMHWTRFFSVSAWCAASLFAQVSHPPAESVARPAAGCASLRSLTTYDFTIATAALVPAKGEDPEHCRVTGQILPEIRFVMSLPSAWNRRLLMLGNGGWAGTLPSAAPHRTVRLGFATVVTDTGHNAAVEPDASFAVNRQKLLDYAFRSLHTTAETAKRVVAGYYGFRPSRSYFTGCSTGGRQALMLAQRFPADFDGIISGAPILDFTGTMLRFAYTAKALAAAPVPAGKLPTLAARVYDRCDASDGLRDGVIDDPRRCDFRPSRDLPQCSGAESDQCFTSAQIATLEKIYGDVMSSGHRLFPGWPVGAEALAGPGGRSGWDGWIIRDGAPSNSAAFAETFFRYAAFPDQPSGFDYRKFDFDKDVSHLEWVHEVLDATDTDLSAFRSRGGKLLMYYGWADQALNAQRGVEYYEDVVRKMGPRTSEFFRLFMVPGMFHCGGGVGVSRFDTLGPLIDWVERDIAPASILASRDKPARTRPLCPYPLTARYKGSGSIDDAANFSCAPPATPLIGQSAARQ